MSRFIAVAAVAFMVGSCAWQVGEHLSSDSVTLMLGLFFGILASLPVAVLVIASNERSAERDRQHARSQSVLRIGTEPIGNRLRPPMEHLTCELCGRPFTLVDGTWRHRCTVMLPLEGRHSDDAFAEWE